MRHVINKLSVWYKVNSMLGTDDGDVFCWTESEGSVNFGRMND